MGDNRPMADLDPHEHYTPGEKSYAMSGKIMLSAIIILFFVVAMMVFLHLYARWYLLRSRRRQIRLRARTRPARTHFVYHFENGGGQHQPAAADPRLGLDPAVIKSLPVFIHSPDTNPDPVDCAVCLSEFEEGETGRILPKCNHCFHIECIDMWFHSHSTCPLCRAPVELPVNPNPVGAGSSCEGPSSESRKPMGLAGITLEVPSRRFNSGFDDDSVALTPTQFRSPVGRILSFTRILSWERRPPSPSPSSSLAAGGVSLPEVDLERGKDETCPESNRG